MHESVNVNNVNSCTRTWFEWANALYVVYVENTMGMDCTDEAEELRKQEVCKIIESEIRVSFMADEKGV